MQCEGRKATGRATGRATRGARRPGSRRGPAGGLRGPRRPLRGLRLRLKPRWGDEEKSEGFGGASGGLAPRTVPGNQVRGASRRPAPGEGLSLQGRGERGLETPPRSPAAPEPAGLGNQETWSLRQQSHQGVELIACHPLIACLHLARMQEPETERGSLPGLRGNFAPTPCSAVSRAARHGGWVLSTLRLTQRHHPVRRTLEVAHSAAAATRPESTPSATAPSGTDSPPVPRTSNQACPKHGCDDRPKSTDDGLKCSEGPTLSLCDPWGWEPRRTAGALHPQTGLHSDTGQSQAARDACPLRAPVHPRRPRELRGLSGLRPEQLHKGQLSFLPAFFFF